MRATWRIRKLAASGNYCVGLARSCSVQVSQIAGCGTAAFPGRRPPKNEHVAHLGPNEDLQDAQRGPHAQLEKTWYEICGMILVQTAVAAGTQLSLVFGAT